MRTACVVLFPVLVALVLATGAGCGGGSAPEPTGPAVSVAVPDFALLDVNPASITHDTAVSPRDHVGRVSAWYFGHAT